MFVIHRLAQGKVVEDWVLLESYGLWRQLGLVPAIQELLAHLNDYTPLPMAVSVNNLAAVDLLLERGAYPHLRTRSDDYEMPREKAEAAGLKGITARLAEYEARKGETYDPER